MLRQAQDYLEISTIGEVIFKRKFQQLYDSVPIHFKKYQNILRSQTLSGLQKQAITEFKTRFELVLSKNITQR